MRRTDPGGTWAMRGRSARQNVPAGHPLRDPSVIRPLAQSRHAQEIQRLASTELQCLLTGSAAERDLLGLLTAAHGGLTALDLAYLAGISPWEAENILRAVKGRTFQARPSLISPETRPKVFLLGHEELQNAATRYLNSQLAGYRQQLHAWVDTWRARRWPADTPEYLLAGYFQLLDDLGDLPRMTVLALAAARHDRMLSLTGGDTAALDETRTTLDRIAAQDEPDLASALALACHRDHLTSRSEYIPTGLAAVWASLGQASRAKTLARSITPAWRAGALAKAAAALAAAGDHQNAETTARSITDPAWQADALANVAAALAAAGHHQHATDLATDAKTAAWSISNLDRQAIAMAGSRKYCAAPVRPALHHVQPQQLAPLGHGQQRPGRSYCSHHPRTGHWHPHWMNSSDTAPALEKSRRNDQPGARRHVIA